MSGAGDSLRRLATRAEQMEQRWPRAAGVEAAAVLERAGRADTGGDGRLSHGRHLGDASVGVTGGGRQVSVRVRSPRLWGVLQKAGRRPRRTWTRAVGEVGPVVTRSADQAFREVVGG